LLQPTTDLLCGSPLSRHIEDIAGGGDDEPTYTFALDPGLVDAPPKPPILRPNAGNTNSSLSMLPPNWKPACVQPRPTDAPAHTVRENSVDKNNQTRTKKNVATHAPVLADAPALQENPDNARACAHKDKPVAKNDQIGWKRNVATARTCVPPGPTGGGQTEHNKTKAHQNVVLHSAPGFHLNPDHISQRRSPTPAPTTPAPPRLINRISTALARCKFLPPLSVLLDGRKPFFVSCLCLFTRT